MQNDKKRQHYVWKKYLKPWTVDGRIWCRRGDDLFNTSPDNVAQEKFFYYAEPLNDAEFLIVHAVIDRAHPSARDTLLRDLEMYRSSSESSEHSRKNSIENYHDLVENIARDSLDRLSEGDRSFLDDVRKRAYFSYFVALQQMRTKKTRQDSISAVSQVPAPPSLEGKYDVSKMENVFALIFADILGNWIHSKGHFVFLNCPTDREFVTSDQPVFNVHKDPKLLVPVTRLELYYPISPKTMVLITDQHDKTDRIVDADELEVINQRIHLESYEQMFARSRGAFPDQNTETL